MLLFCICNLHDAKVGEKGNIDCHMPPKRVSKEGRKEKDATGHWILSLLSLLEKASRGSVRFSFTKQKPVPKLCVCNPESPSHHQAGTSRFGVGGCGEGSVAVLGH